MKVTGVICEYNPFHRGHEYHLRETKKDCDYLICVMSGSFMQRGEPALTDKWLRTRAALAGGADLVMELPAVYALSSAEMFARGGVSALTRLNVCDRLSFGASASLEALQALEHTIQLHKEELDTLCRETLSSGLSYPAAMSEALARLTGNPEMTALSAEPNNILGLEYLKALRKCGSPMQPLAIERKGALHNDDSLCEFSSSGSIRKALREGNTDAAFSALPAESRTLLESALREGRTSDRSVYELLCLAALRQADLTRLADLPDVAEGLENRLMKAAHLPTLEQVMTQVKTKRYTHARIARILAHNLLGITRTFLQGCDYASGTSYARILGFRKTAAPLLEEIKAQSSIPVLSSAKDLNALTGKAKSMLSMDLKATDLYSLTLTDPRHRTGVADYTHPLVIL